MFRGMSLLCLGDEFRGVDAGLEDLDEPARNLSRKCCSQSAEGIMWFCFVFVFVLVRGGGGVGGGVVGFDVLGEKMV